MLPGSEATTSDTQSDPANGSNWKRWAARGLIAFGETAGGGDLEGTVYELDVEYYFAKRFSLRVGYQTASLELVRGINRSIYVADARAQIPKLGVFWTRPRGEGPAGIAVGLIGGHESFTGIRTSPSGLQRSGLEEITSKNGLLFGGEVDIEANIGHGMFVGGMLALMFAKDARIEMKSPSVGYMDSTRWAPMLLGLSAGYRFH